MSRRFRAAAWNCGGHPLWRVSRLAADGLITQTREEVVGGRRRRYYQLTGPGYAVLAEEAARLSFDGGCGQCSRRGRRPPSPRPA